MPEKVQHIQDGIVDTVAESVLALSPLRSAVRK